MDEGLMDGVDPKYEPSNTQRRARLAARRIPQVANELRVGAREFSERSIELLYRECRAYHRNRRPFRSELKRCRPRATHLYSDWGTNQLLELVKTPQLVSRQELLSAVWMLHQRVAVDSQAPERVMA